MESFHAEEGHTQRCDQQHAEHVAFANEGDTQQYDREQERYTHPHRVRILSHRLPDGPRQDGSHDDDIGIDARIVRHAQHVDEQQFEESAYLHQTLHHAVHHHGHEGERDKQCRQCALQRGVGVLPIIIYEYHGGDTEQVQEVHPNADPHEVGDKHDPAIGVRSVGHLFPFQDQPKDKGREERRRGVNLTLDGAKPERIAERVSQRAHDATAHHHHGACQRQLALPFLEDNAPRHVRDAPKEEEDGQGAEEGRHRVDHLGHLSRVRG